MKLFAIIFAALVATAAATPAPETEKTISLISGGSSRNGLIADIVSAFLEMLSETLRALGLDPFTLREASVGFALPVPSLFNINLRVEDLKLAGISDIVINNLSFGILTQRLTYDISMPEISIEIGDFTSDVIILSELIPTQVAGKLVIKNPGVSGRVRVSLGIVSGVTIRELEINFYIDDINAQFEKLSFLNRNYAALVNRFINGRVFPLIVDHQEEISELVEIIVWVVINQIL